MAEQSSQAAAGTPAATPPQQPAGSGFVGSSTGTPITEPKPEPGAAAQPPPGSPPEPPQPPAAGTPGEPAAASGDDARPTIGHGGEMSAEAISERVARERRKVLKEIYGTDDETQIAKIKEQQASDTQARKQADEELAKFRKAEEERKRAEMTELQRAKADSDAKDQELQQVRQQLEELRTGQVVTQTDTEVRSEILEFADEQYVDLVRPALARHYLSLAPEDQKDFDERARKRWVQKFVKDHPALAKKPPEPGTPPIKHPRRAPVSTSRAEPSKGQPSPASSAGPGSAGGKVVQPGKPNSMSKSELDQHYKETRGRRKPW